MKSFGYSNPIRGAERRMEPGLAQKQFATPGLKMPKPSGLGSLRHTMPHLRKSVSIQRLQGGGSLDPVGQIYAAARPNLYNPDPMHRRVLDAMRQIPMINRSMTAMPFSTAQFSYAGGGEAEDGGGKAPEDVMQPEDQQPEASDEERQVVVEAMAALEGQHPQAEEALAHFIDVFGARALADLQRLVEAKHRDQEEGEEGEEETEEMPEEQPPSEEEEPDELAGAGGGLLHGQGTGQSDEIEGTTPSGKPVLLSDGEYVIDAPTVAALGDGSTSAGAKRLDELRKQIRRDAYGHDKQAKPMRKGGSALVLRLGK